MIASDLNTYGFCKAGVDFLMESNLPEVLRPCATRLPTIQTSRGLHQPPYLGCISMPICCACPSWRAWTPPETVQQAPTRPYPCIQHRRQSGAVTRTKPAPAPPLMVGSSGHKPQQPPRHRMDHRCRRVLTPDPVRDAPDGRGDGQSPGAGAWIPGRATRDTSFTRFPMAMVILCYACAHASAYTGTFWVNQRTIARDLEMSQQAVSRHFRKLVELGYLEKVRNENTKRPYGKKGAVWRVIYDPTQSLKTWKLPQPGCIRQKRKNNRPPQAPSKRPQRRERTAVKAATEGCMPC